MESVRDAIIAKMGAVPSIPVSAASAMRMLRDERKSISDAIRAIEYDPGLTANILKLVNSSAFCAGGRRISSLQEAAVRLGAANIMQMLIGSSMSSMMIQPVRGYDLPPGELWKSAVSAAICTECMGKTLKMKMPPHAFTAALLRDIGKMVMGSFIDVNAESIISLSIEKGISFSMAEKEVLGIDHAELGALLLAQWNLPEELHNPVRWHHAPERCPEPDRQVAEIVHVADVLTIFEGIGAGCEGLNYTISPDVATRMGLTRDAIDEITTATQARREEVKEFYSRA